MAYDFDALYNEAQADAMSGGKRRYYDNRVEKVSETRDGGKAVISAVVRGRGEYHPKIIFDERGGLYDYDCDCDVFDVSRGPCRHIVASALAFEDRNPQQSASENELKTSPPALALITEYSKKKHGALSVDEAKVSLIPTLELRDRLYVRFSIGRKKLYRISDVTEFAALFSSAGYKRYGVELELKHTTAAFADASLPLLRFLLKCVGERESSESGRCGKDELRLGRSDVDKLMNILGDRIVEFGENGIKTGLRLVAPTPDSMNPSVRIEHVDGGFEIALSIFGFRLFYGLEYTYFVTDTRIYACTDDWCEKTLSLVKALGVHKSLTVADSDMSVFYNTVLAPVADCVRLDSNGIDLSGFEAPPFWAKIFIDLELDGSVTARLECGYDDVAVDVDDSGASIGFRDWETERGLKNVLARYFPHYPSLKVSDEGDLYLLLSEGLSEIMGYAEVYLADGLKRMRVRKSPKIKVGVRLESDLLKVDVSSEEYTRAELDAILAAYREKKNYIRLEDGSFVSLADSNLGTLSDVLDTASGNLDALPKYYAPYLNDELKSGFFVFERDKQFKALLGALSSAGEADVEVPEKLRDVLRNYQKTGYRWMRNLIDHGFCGILADDMGLGKTVQIIALIESEPGGTSLIVCPTTLILNWINEFLKFAPTLKVAAVTGTPEERRATVERAGEYDVIVTSYELLRRDEELYRDLEFSFTVLDEAQYIKNPETKNARSVKILKSKHRFALTGTPIENGLSELWSIFDFVMPGYLYSYPKFRETFELEVVRGNAAATRRLKKLVAPFILRRLKSDVLTELPPKVESSVVSPLEGEQRDVYFANLSQVRASVLTSGQKFNKIAVLAMLTKLRQICCDPALVYPEYAGNSAKTDACLELTASAVESGHKVLIFSQFTSVLEILRKRLIEADISHYLLQGDTPKAERLRLVNRFNTDDTKVFLISLKAGGTGLNLTGADVVIHYDPWWNESVMNQATDRAYRIGQSKSVQVYKLILQDTVEQKILKLQQRKSALSGLLVDEGLAKLLPADLDELLS